MWQVDFISEFAAEFDTFSGDVQDAISARIILLEREGPHVGRPHVDTLKGSKHANMKELRCPVAKGAWRVAFAFDPERRAILLAAGDKSGVSKSRFYRKLITTADKRFDSYLKGREG